MTNQASDLAYTADYKKDILGKSTKDPAIAYPEHDRLKKIHNDTNKAAYQKDSKAQNKHNVYPVDAMEFKRATEAAKHASDVSLMHLINFNASKLTKNFVHLAVIYIYDIVFEYL